MNNTDVVNGLVALLGSKKVLADDNARANADGMMTRNFEKAFGWKQVYLPICVVKAHCTDDVVRTMKYCNENGISVIVKTGGTCSEDQMVVVNDHTIFLDEGPMDQVISIDEENMMATVGPGMPLARLEELVNKKGLTTGHCPQSQPLAFMGGLVATRSIGQFSTYYGGIEDLLCGLEAVLPSGKVIRIRNVPRRSAGPDLRHLFLGSEGALAAMTEITVKLFRYYPEDMWKGGYVVDSFGTGLDCIREIMTSGYKPSVVRLYDKPDADLNYGSVELKDGEAFMFFTAEGPKSIAQATGAAIDEIALRHGAKYIGTQAVDHWFQTRNNICNVIGKPEAAEEFRQTRVVYATVEICADWTDIKKIYNDVMERVPQKIEHLILLGGHVSHSYLTGTNIYFVYQLAVQEPLNASDEVWSVMKAICDEVIKYPTGGIAHHHGIGKVRVKMVHEELGSSYVLMDGLKKMMDPNGIMNPGVLIPLE